MRGLNIKTLNQVTSRQIKQALEKSQKTNVVKVGLSFVGPGEYIIYVDDNGNKQLGQFIECIDFRDMDEHHQQQSNLDPELIIDDRDRFVLVWQFDAHDNISNPKLDTDKYNLVPKDLGEAIPTSKCRYISENKVQSIAFVFHIEDIQEGKYQPVGMEIAFAVRRIRNKDGRTRKLNNNFTSFYDKVGYSKRMWDVTTAIQEYSRRRMSCGGDWNGRYDGFNLPGINEEAYHHLTNIMFCSNHVGELLTINDTKTGKERATKVMHSNLANENKRVRFYSMMTRGIDEPSLKRFKGSMGSRIGIANPMPVPKMSNIDNGSKKSLVNLRNNELVRYTTCLPDVVDSEADKQIMPLEVTSIFNKQDGDDMRATTYRG